VRRQALQRLAVGRLALGFTLVEILVAMSLLAVVMVATLSAMRTMAQTEVRVDDRLQRLDQMRVVNGFLRSALGRVESTLRASAQAPGERHLQFLADAKSISWVGIMPARHGAGGRYFFHLAVQDVGSETALVLRYAPWAAQPEFPDWTLSESQILVKNVVNFQVEAEGLPMDLQTTSPTWPIGWNTGWVEKTALPQRVRLSWADQVGAWPPLVVSITPTAQSQSNSGGFTTGGSVR
jgi:general secretion pathway protein J